MQEEIIEDQKKETPKMGIMERSYRGIAMGEVDVVSTKLTWALLAAIENQDTETTDALKQVLKELQECKNIISIGFDAWIKQTLATLKALGEQKKEGTQ